MEEALSKWKVRVAGMGLNGCACKILTHVRYADDLLLYTSSWRDFVFMMECLDEELAKLGFENKKLHNSIVIGAIIR